MQFDKHLWDISHCFNWHGTLCSPSAIAELLIVTIKRMYFPGVPVHCSVHVSQVIRFIMWWWCVVRYKNTTGTADKFSQRNVNFKHISLQALPQLYMHSSANINATIIQMQSNTNTTDKFIQIIKYSIKRFIQSSPSIQTSSLQHG